MESDDDRFLSVAMQIASHAARSGKGNLARELRQLVGESKKARPPAYSLRPVPILRPGGELAGLVNALFSQDSFG